MGILDIVIIVLLIGFGFWGYVRGLFASLGGLLSFLLAGLVSFLVYHRLGQIISRYFDISLNMAELLTIFLVFFFLTIVFSILATQLSNKIQVGRFAWLDKILGIPTGIIEGLILISAILLILSVLPSQAHLGSLLLDSQFASFLTDKTSKVYQRVKAELGPKIPQFIFYPEHSFSEEKYSQLITGIDWQKLDGATCFACGGHVKYLGIKKHIVQGQEVWSPYFVCTSCGRHSDGCQTYEGYHQIYGECPQRLGELGYRFDCGMWPNGNFVKPVGQCPVCHPAEVKVPFQFPLFYPSLKPINLLS